MQQQPRGVDSQASAAAATSRATVDSPTFRQHEPTIDEPASLITPIKPTEQVLRAKKKQLQLQLALVNKKREEQKKHAVVKWPPVASVKSLPPLAGRMMDLQKDGAGFNKMNTIEFEVNQECEFLIFISRLVCIMLCLRNVTQLQVIPFLIGTSLALVPSGRLAIAGFTDGTLRLFDLTGTFLRDRNDPRNSTHDSFDLFDTHSSSEESEEEMEMPKNKGRSGVVCSHVNQRFGVVACQ
jgi:hypothetical protein